MPEEDVVRFCSPTLAGLKTGSLFNCRYPSEEAMRADLREWNKRLKPKGVRVLPMRYSMGKALIYLYRPGRLHGDLRDPVACGLLENRGYPLGDPDRCVVCLARRIKDASEFPHEIGLFLGYPPDDVLGFIRNGAARCKCVGDWKVYGDEVRAKQLFQQYRKCTAAFSDQLAKGKTLEQLTVTTHTTDLGC